MKKYTHDHNQQGFTLIEVMMAMVILGVGILAIVALQTRNVTYNAGSKKQTEGYTRAMDQIEKLYVADYGAIPLGVTIVDLAILNPPYPYTVTSTVLGHPTIPNAKTVNVQVAWNGQLTRPVAQVVFTRTKKSF
jgi:type IV pilus assembly protein PilV